MFSDATSLPGVLLSLPGLHTEGHSTHRRHAALLPWIYLPGQT